MVSGPSDRFIVLFKICWSSGQGMAILVSRTNDDGTGALATSATPIPSRRATRARRGCRRLLTKHALGTSRSVTRQPRTDNEDQRDEHQHEEGTLGGAAAATV